MPRFLADPSESNAPFSKPETEMKGKQEAIRGQERERESQQSLDSCPYPTQRQRWHCSPCCVLEGTDKHVLSGTIPGLLEALRDEQNQRPL